MYLSIKVRNRVFAASNLVISFELKFFLVAIEPLISNKIKLTCSTCLTSSFAVEIGKFSLSNSELFKNLDFSKFIEVDGDTLATGSNVEKKSYEIKIADVTFKLKSGLDESTVNELAKYVDERVKQAINSTKSGSFQNASILAALNIAEELILLKRKANRELERLEDKAIQLSHDLENSKNHRLNQ